MLQRLLVELVRVDPTSRRVGGDGRQILDSHALVGDGHAKARVEPRSGFVAVDRFNWPTEHVVEVAAVGQHSWIVLVGPPEVLESLINGIYSASISGVR